MNVIIIMADSWRVDHIGYYGNEWIQTPNLDRFAEESCVFDMADSWRVDHIGYYGNEWIQTPNLDRFAEESCVFGFFGRIANHPNTHLAVHRTLYLSFSGLATS